MNSEKVPLRKLVQAWFVYAIAGWSQPVEKSGSIYCVNCELECSSMCTSCIGMKWTIGLKAVVDVDVVENSEDCTN